MKYWFVRSPFKTRKWTDVLMAGVFNLYGIRGNAARKNISLMEKGDMALWYSSSDGKKVYGTMKVYSMAYPDKTGDNGWLAIDFLPAKTFGDPVTIKEINETLGNPESKIIKQTRISVIDISKNEYDEIVKIGK